MYRVTKYFTDLQDNGHVYRVGDSFPRPNLKVSKERIQELLTGSNRRGIPLIEEIIEDVPEKPLETSQKPKKTRKPRAKKNAD